MFKRKNKKIKRVNQELTFNMYEIIKRNIEEHNFCTFNSEVFSKAVNLDIKEVHKVLEYLEICNVISCYYISDVIVSISLVGGYGDDK